MSVFGDSNEKTPADEIECEKAVERMPAAGPHARADLTNFDAGGTNIVNLKIGGRFVVDQGSFYVGYGHALTDAAWYNDILRFEYRWSF